MDVATKFDTVLKGYEENHAENQLYLTKEGKNQMDKLKQKTIIHFSKRKFDERAIIKFIRSNTIDLDFYNYLRPTKRNTISRIVSTIRRRWTNRNRKNYTRKRSNPEHVQEELRKRDDPNPEHDKLQEKMRTKLDAPVFINGHIEPPQKVPEQTTNVEFPDFVDVHDAVIRTLQRQKGSDIHAPRPQIDTSQHKSVEIKKDAEPAQGPRELPTAMTSPLVPKKVTPKPKLVKIGKTNFRLWLQMLDVETFPDNLKREMDTITTFKLKDTDTHVMISHDLSKYVTARLRER